ncbi:MAG TPA: Gfo/Idh/MocA family oxidoreductase [Gemmatimonadaceae bacterium]|nr:Gfo/Idh/MocA family oxidoreductase [Gemmatimonadaceae bacterium]
MARKKVSRRDFVADAGKLALGAAILPNAFPTIVPRHVLGGPGYIAPSDQLAVAIAGCGGMGSSNAYELSKTERIVAVCDVDLGFSARNIMGRVRKGDGTPNPDGIRLKEQFDRAAKYDDWREMLDKQKDIEGVVVATPDHNHAVIANAAMLHGKHVYVQKPLTYSVHEARTLRETARKTGVKTQMGNQGHSGDGARLINEWIQAGVIGPVHEVYVWTDRPYGWWPQGVPRPDRMPAPPGIPVGSGWGQRRLDMLLANAMAGDFSPPPGVRWDLYLGPVAEDIPYHPIYHPFNWRGWTQFGMGALGDMGAHLIDHPYWALGLTQPVSIEATSTPWGTSPEQPAPGEVGANGQPARARQVKVTYPVATTVHYQFPAVGSRPPVKLTWCDGGFYPPRPDVLPDTIELKNDGGVIFMGEKGILMHDTYGENPRCFPESLMDAARAVPKTMARISVSHERNWALACKGQAQESSPIEYAAQLTETMLLGVVALRAGAGKKILYDAQNMRITNDPEANQYLTREYRPGWAI